MQIGMIGLGKMGTDRVRRLLEAGQECVGHDRHPEAIDALVDAGTTGAATFDSLVTRLAAPRIVWLMVPAGGVDAVIRNLLPLLEIAATIIDGGNSHYRDDIRAQRRTAVARCRLHRRRHERWDRRVRARVLPHGRWRGPVLRAIATDLRGTRPGRGSSATDTRTARRRRHRRGRLSPLWAAWWRTLREHGPQRYRLRPHGSLRRGAQHPARREHGPRGRGVGCWDRGGRRSDFHQYDLDLVQITEVWRCGSVVGWWLLDSTAAELPRGAILESFAERVSDSGDGR
jgi:6-phosphogluconate dehydrogenase